MQVAKAFGAARVLLGVVALGVAVVVVSITSGMGSAVSSAATSLYFEYIVDGDKAARTRLSVDSFGVASNHFPLGSGFGRFGSYLARVNYSPEYTQLGYRSIYGLSDLPGWGRWLTDTQWPAILGEAGYLGAACYLLGLGIMLARFLKLGSAQDQWAKFVGLVGTGWMVLSIIDSIASPTFTASPSFPWIFALAGAAWTLERNTSAPKRRAIFLISRQKSESVV